MIQLQDMQVEYVPLPGQGADTGRNGRIRVRASDGAGNHACYDVDLPLTIARTGSDVCGTLLAVQEGLFMVSLMLDTRR